MNRIILLIIPYIGVGHFLFLYSKFRKRKEEKFKFWTPIMLISSIWILIIAIGLTLVELGVIK